MTKKQTDKVKAPRVERLVSILDEIGEAPRHVQLACMLIMEDFANKHDLKLTFGFPPIDKSDIIKDVAEKHNILLELTQPKEPNAGDYAGMPELKDPTDIHGIPAIVNGRKGRFFPDKHEWKPTADDWANHIIAYGRVENRFEYTFLLEVVIAISKRVTKDNFEKVIEFANQLSFENNRLVIHACISNVPVLQGTLEFMKWINQHKKELLK